MTKAKPNANQEPQLTQEQQERIDKKKTEYAKALERVESYAAMADLPSFQALREHVQNLRSMAISGLLDGEKKDFDANQGVYKAANALVAPIRIAVDNLNALSRPGELPLWGETTATAKFDKKKWTIEIVHAKAVPESVRELAKEGAKIDEGATDMG